MCTHPAIFRTICMMAVVLAHTLSVPQLSAVDAVRLTSDGHLKRDALFVNEGKEIVYTYLESPVQLRLMRLDLEMGTSKPLHTDASKNEFEPDVSSDDRYEAFVQSRGNLSLALVIRDTKTSQDAEIKPSGGFSGMRSPAISPDQKRVLYCYPEDGRQQIYSVNL